jgi:hypothetical protein
MAFLRVGHPPRLSEWPLWWTPTRPQTPPVPGTSTPGVNPRAAHRTARTSPVVVVEHIQRQWRLGQEFSRLLRAGPARSSGFVPSTCRRRRARRRPRPRLVRLPGRCGGCPLSLVRSSLWASRVSSSRRRRLTSGLADRTGPDAPFRTANTSPGVARRPAGAMGAALPTRSSNNTGGTWQHDHPPQGPSVTSTPGPEALVLSRVDH